MDIKLWYSEEMEMWRWSLVDINSQPHSGQRKDLREAMNDVATTVEYIISITK